MRKELKKISNVRTVFRGTFVRYGTKSGYKGPERTLLLRDIISENGKQMTDHLWFNLTKGFQSLGKLDEGDIIEFAARCRPYKKGYKGYREDVYNPVRLDYKLFHPTKIRKIMPDERGC